MIAHKIASILTAGILLGTTTMALANRPAACIFSPRQQQAEFSHLPKVEQAQVVRDFKTGCTHSQTLTHVIAAKVAMLDAVLLQPKINTDKVKLLLKEINHLQAKQLKNKTYTSVKIAKESGIHLGLPTMMAAPATAVVTKQ